MLYWGSITLPIMEISKVTPEDIPAITALQDELLLDKRGRKAENGFLVSGFSEEDYLRFTGIHEYFFKITEDGNLAGVLMAYESTNIPPEDKNNSLLRYVLRKDFVLIKQIFVSPSFGNRGIATKLYKHLFAMISPDKPAVAVVVIEPFNKLSCEFHKRRGFYEFLNFIPEPDHDDKVRKRSAWIRPAANDDDFLDDIRLMNVHDGADDVGQTMSTRISNLVSLYEHEDNLNWTKIGRQCTILFALIAVLAYFYDKDLPNESYPLLLILGIAGIILNVMFLRKIKSGLTYMNTYKQKIKDYDQKLAFSYPKVSVIFDDGAFISKRSVTTKLLQWLSWTGIVIWILATLFLLLKVLFPAASLGQIL